MNFRASERGNVGILGALAFLPVLGALGLAFDFSIMSTLKNRLQGALDRGVLAAASTGNNSVDERRFVGEQVFAVNLPKNLSIEFDVSIDINDTGKVTGIAEVHYQPLIMSWFGFENLPVNVTSEAMAEGGQADLEIVMVLDYSSSMKSKYTGMRTAALELVQTLSKNDDADIKFGLVPFAGEIYTTMDSRFVKGEPYGSSWTGCTMSRKWPFVIKDKTPTGSDNSKWGHDGDDCEEYISRNLIVMPLSDDHNAVIDQLRIMRPYSGTNTSLGAEIGYQVLSPNLPFAASAFFGEKQKFMIMLSDGGVSRPSYGPGGRFTKEQARKNLRSVCGSLAANGVTVITVLYETDSMSARSDMRDCASSPDMFMEATEGDISQKFKRISKIMGSEARLTK